jgi:hypothetical protein
MVPVGMMDSPFDLAIRWQLGLWLRPSLRLYGWSNDDPGNRQGRVGNLPNRGGRGNHLRPASCRVEAAQEEPGDVGWRNDHRDNEGHQRRLQRDSYLLVALVTHGFDCGSGGPRPLPGDANEYTAEGALDRDSRAHCLFRDTQPNLATRSATQRLRKGPPSTAARGDSSRSFQFLPLRPDG